jgi:hypothetical protein
MLPAKSPAGFLTIRHTPLYHASAVKGNSLSGSYVPEKSPKKRVFLEKDALFYEYYAKV